MEELLFEFGDILWCNREFVPAQIRERHTSGPFIFLGAKDGYFYCLKGFGIRSDSRRNMNNFVIDVNTYHLRKATEFHTKSVYKVPVNYFLTYISSLSGEDKNILKESLVRSSNHFETTKELLEEIGIDLKCNFRTGSIIKNDNDEEFLVLKANNDGTYDVAPYVLLDKGKVFIDFNQFRTNEDCKDCQLIHTLFDFNKKYVDVYEFIHKNQEPGENKIRLGTIVEINGLLFYVSTVEANKLLTYKILLNSEKSNVSVLGQNMEIEFEQKAIDKEKAKYVCTLSDEDIDVIRNAKKSKKIQSKRAKQYYQTDINPIDGFGRIVYLRNNLSLMYGLYKILDGNIIEVVDLNSLKNRGVFKLEKLHIREFDLRIDKHQDLVSFIRSIDKKINDERYHEFLFNNGCFDEYVKAGGKCRKRKNNA